MIELERTKELAKKYKMNLREVNDKAGLGRNSIYNWKNQRPGIDALNAVADVLHTSADYLSGKTNNPSPSPKGDETGGISIDGEVPYFYHGYTIPEDYLNIVRQLMERDIKKGLIKRHD
ncbi:helix-turn-helix domain-containing protein, partial [Lactobacillus crispatus]